jgi:predicted HTH domain antitoxin
VDSKRRLRTALPRGEFKAPESGWLVIAGRRGHYEFCDTTRAYDLETGTAFIADSCSGLALQPGGTVNVQETNIRRKEKIQAGIISADNLREALWMLLFRREAVELQLTAEWVPLPLGMTPEITIQELGRITFGRSMSVNTSQTLLVWRWLREGQMRFDGDLTWPGSYAAAEDHAATLLNVAEQSFVEGCPRRSLPSSVSIRVRQPVNRLDAPSESVDKGLEKALTQWNAIPVCHRARSPVTGSIAIARRAGTARASSETANSSAMTELSVTGSIAPTPTA